MHPSTVDGKAAPVQAHSQAASRRSSPIGPCLITDVATVPGAALNSNRYLVKIRTTLRATPAKRTPAQPKRTRKPTEEAKKAFNAAVPEAMAGGANTWPNGRAARAPHGGHRSNRSSWTRSGKHSAKPSRMLSRNTYQRSPVSQYVGTDPKTFTGPRGGQRRGGNEAQQRGPQTSTQRQNPVAQRPPRGERTDSGRQDEMEMDQAHPLRLQAAAGIHPQQRKASQPVQASRDLRGTPGQLRGGPAIPSIHWQQRPPRPTGRCQHGPLHDGGANNKAAGVDDVPSG